VNGLSDCPLWGTGDHIRLGFLLVAYEQSCLNSLPCIRALSSYHSNVASYQSTVDDKAKPAGRQGRKATGLTRQSGCLYWLNQNQRKVQLMKDKKFVFRRFTFIEIVLMITFSICFTGMVHAATDLALSGIATQSSTTDWGNGPAVASRAIDGDTDGNFWDGSVTHSADEQAWWQVDLGQTYDIYNITRQCIWNASQRRDHHQHPAVAV
jgi:hypothetical protein